MSEHHKGKWANKIVTFLNTLQKVTIIIPVKWVFGKCNSTFQVPLENTYPTLGCAGWTRTVGKDSSVPAVSYTVTVRAFPRGSCSESSSDSKLRSRRGNSSARFINAQSCMDGSGGYFSKVFLIICTSGAIPD